MEEQTKQEFDSGIMALNIVGGDRLEVDIYRTKLALEEFESKHEPFTEGWTVSSDALSDLIDALGKAGLKDISGSLAMEIWNQVNTHWLEAKKKWNFIRSSPDDTESAPQDSVAAS